MAAGMHCRIGTAHCSGIRTFWVLPPMTAISFPVTFVRLIGPRMVGQWIKAEEDKPLLQTEFQLPTDWPYARLEIEDADGKRAWSNPLWVSG